MALPVSSHGGRRPVHHPKLRHIHAWAAALLTLALQAAAPLRIQDPLQTAGLATGWDVDPAKGALTLRVAGATVPGDIPIPVVFRFNAAHAVEARSVRVWGDGDDEARPGLHRYVPTVLGLDRGIFGTMHFGFQTTGSPERIPAIGPAGKRAIHVPSPCLVLEDGAQYTDADLTPFATTVGGPFNLAGHFGLGNPDPARVRVDPSGRLALYEAAPADLGAWAARAGSLAPGATAFRVFLDRDRARILAPLGDRGTWVPILWLDRFGHAVAFTHGASTGVRVVTALNDQGKGVRLQWAEAPAGDRAQALVRLDYLGLPAPSMLITGYPGTAAARPSALGATPAAALMSVAGGPVLRPLEARIGSPGSLPAPPWLAVPPPPFVGDGSADQVWTFAYDGAGAELLRIVDDRGVATDLAWQTSLFCNPELAVNNEYRSVATARSTDALTGAERLRAWTWALPVVGNEATWTTRVSERWSGPEVAPAPAATIQYTFAPPRDPHFGNAMPRATATLDGDGRVLRAVERTFQQVGGDGTLSGLTQETSSSLDGPTVYTLSTLDAATGVPLTVQTSTRPCVDLATYTYENHPDLLDPRRLASVTHSRTRGGVTLTAPVRRLTYDPVTWLPLTDVLDGGADGTLGKRFVLDGTALVATVNDDAWGARRELIFGSGASNTWNRSPDGTRILGQTLAPLGQGPMIRTYAYDDRERLTQAGEWTNLAHDDLGRLTQATLAPAAGLPLPSGDGPLAYGYDGYGNNTSASGGAGAAFTNFALAVPAGTNQLPGLALNGAVTGWTFSADGEALTLGTGPAALASAWDGLGRMTGAGASTFAYLPSGLRASRTGPAGNRLYAYSTAGQLLTEFRQDLNGARDLVHLGDRVIAEIDLAGVHELHTDHLGTPILVTSRSSGATEGWQVFGPYGEKVAASGYEPTTGFTGHTQTEPGGLIYMRGRFYSPAWHRFLSCDPGADPAQANRFAYCAGSPLMATDPSGFWVFREKQPQQASTGEGSGDGWRWFYFSGPGAEFGSTIPDAVLGGYRTPPRGDAFANPKYLGGTLIAWDDTIQGKSFLQVGDYTVVTDLDGRITNSWVGAISAIGFEITTGVPQADQRTSFGEYFQRRWSAPGELLSSYGVSNKAINVARGLTIVGAGRGLWGGYKTIKSAGLTAGTSVGALTTLFDVTGAGGLGNSLIQLEKGANVFGLGMAVLEGAYALGSAAGALGDVIGDM